MKMLTKFELKLLRAKGVAFHPKRAWVLVALHLLTVQLWDYRMGTLIDRFEDHTGPVRCVDFHPTQPLFVLGLDDYTIKVWLLVLRKCLFTLAGHLDYLRGVSFHHDLPWILLCLDDQTIRIWNWQSRTEIACLTGHNHYVMLAQFHPTDDMIVLASLDQTVRVWDISVLRKKHLAPQLQRFDDQLQRRPLPQQDIFGNVSAIVKFVLEGHDKGVNFAAFHPTLPLIVLAADDRLVKLWRMSEVKAWEVDSCRGHTGNVLAAVFHPHQDLILLVLDDKTVRVWDLNKRTPVKQFRRENDRFWLVAPHPKINLFAACHDLGVMVFKLERERPAHAVAGRLYYVNREKQVQLYDFDKEAALMPMLSLKKIGKPWAAMRTLLYNQADNSVLVTHGDGDGQYALVLLPRHITGAIEPTDVRLGDGSFAAFIARNRFVTFVKSTRVLAVRDLANAVTRSIQLDALVLDVLAGAPGRLLLVKAHLVVSYDVQQRREVAEYSMSSVKYAAWLPDGLHVALLAKHSIGIVTKDLEPVAQLHETIRVKSAAWDDLGVLLYSTLNHIKFALLNGDSGIVRTLHDTLYIVKVTGAKLYTLTRDGTVELVQIDPTEYRFKRALVNRHFAEALRIIRNSTLVGQNIIGYLQKKGYPDVALQFVQDPESRFDLAVQCGDLAIAETEAEKLGKSAWERLAKVAAAQGALTLVERAYQRLEQFDKLLFLYLVKGDTERLGKMGLIAAARQDPALLVLNSIWAHDTELRIAAFEAAGLAPLAYTLAMALGQTERAEAIRGANKVKALAVEAPVAAPAVVGPQSDWPLLPPPKLFLENELVEAPTPVAAGAAPAAVAMEAPEEDEEGGWDLDIEEAEVQVEEEEETEMAVWLRSNKTAAGCVAAGAFDQAALLLHRQLGVVDFAPLRARFLEVYAANKVYVPGIDDLAAMRAYVRSDNDEEDPAKFRPYVCGMEQLEERLLAAFKLFRTNNLDTAVAQFREIVHVIAVGSVDLEEEEQRCEDILTLCREYIVGLLMELERRQLAPLAVKRNLELAAYFARLRLQSQHRVNALQVAMLQLFKHRNYSLAAHFASEILELVPLGPKAELAQRIREKAELVLLDAVDIDFDPFAEFDVCCALHTPIYEGEPLVAEALTGALYKPEFKGEVCRVTQVTGIGAPALGLRIKI